MARSIPVLSTGRVVEVAGGARRWVDVPNGRAPAVSAKVDFTYSVDLDAARASSIHARYGFVGRERAPVETEAIFRVRLLSEPTATNAIVFEQRLASREAPFLERLDRPLTGVDDDGGVEGAPGRLVFEVQFLGAEPAGRRLAAGWVEPVIEIHDTIEVRRNRHLWDVLLITSDTTRQDRLSPYGGSARMPALEKLASDGIRLTNAFSMAYGTTPSHSSLLTGSYAREHGVYDNETILSDEQLTLAEVVREHGYATSAFVSARPLIRQLGFDQGFELFDDVFVFDATSGLGTYSGAERRADVTAERFLEWLQRERGGPFFSWVHFYDPHQPYVPLDAGSLVGVDGTESHFRTPDGQPVYLRARDLLQEPQAIVEAVDRAARLRYDLELEFMDRQIGRILAQLEALDLYANTLVVFVADHGEYFIERGIRAFGHSGLNVEVTRLPLLIKLPGSRAAGTTADFLLGNIDIAPTVLDVLGIDTPAVWSGKSFLPLLGEPSSPEFRDYVLLEGYVRQAVSVRTKRWMLRRITDGHLERRNIFEYLGYEPGRPAELFDLLSDPNEQTVLDVSTEPIAAELEDLLEGFLGGGPGARGETFVSPEHRKALEALGYTR